MNYIQLIHQILDEKDIYLKALECFLLGKKLLDYIGPITSEYLELILPMLSIKSIWDLSLLAKYEIIRKKALEKLDDIFDYYEMMYKEKEKLI